MPDLSINWLIDLDRRGSKLLSIIQKRVDKSSGYIFHDYNRLSDCLFKKAAYFTDIDDGCVTIENLINGRNLNEENADLIYFFIFLLILMIIINIVWFYINKLFTLQKKYKKYNDYI